MTERSAIGLAKTCMGVVLLLACVSTLSAAPITIVALGTSNSKGKGLPSSQSYPAQLQALLRARGHDVRVINLGVNGDTTAGILARVNAVPNATRLVLLEYAGKNEARNHITNSTANMAEIQSRLQARNIKCIDITAFMSNEFRVARAAGNLILPKDPHLNATAYGEVAAQLLPQVEAEIGR